MAKKWSDSEIEYLINNYYTSDLQSICKHLNRTVNSVHLKISRLGLTEFKNKFDRNFFDEIDNHIKAYWLGFIYADGYITGGDTGHEIGIELQRSDNNHIHKFITDIKGNMPIQYRERHATLDGRSISSQTCFIRLYSNHMVSSLINHGVMYRKSLQKHFPRGLNEKYIFDFIRGYFDGNGTLCQFRKGNKKYWRGFITTGSKFFADELSEYLSSVKIDNYVVQAKEHEYKVHINSHSLNYFIQKLYNNADTYLDRKYEIYQRFNTAV